MTTSLEYSDEHYNITLYNISGPTFKLIIVFAYLQNLKAHNLIINAPFYILSIGILRRKRE